MKTRHYNPSKRLRHPKLDYQELVKQSEEQYVDFQQAGVVKSCYIILGILLGLNLLSPDPSHFVTLLSVYKVKLPACDV